jgi:hypothetical protein
MVPGARDLRVNGAACAAEKRVCKLTKTKRPSPLTQPTSLEISLTGTITLETPVIEIAVGTVIADCPPRGPGRALISASGSYLG